MAFPTIFRALFFLVLLGFDPLKVLACTLSQNISGVAYRLNTSAATQPVNFYLDSATLSGKDALIRNGALMWSGISGSYITLNEVGSAATAQIVIQGGGSNANTMDRGGQAVASRVVLTLGQAILQDTDDNVLNGAAHEVGHVLGLGHTANSRSIMSYDRAGITGPSDDDRLAFLMLYSNDPQQLPLGCASIRSKGGDGPGPDPRLPEVILYIGVLLLAMNYRIFRTLKKWCSLLEEFRTACANYS